MLSLNQRGGNVMTSDEFLVQEVQALAARLSGPAITADTAWTGLDLGVTVVSIR